MEDSKVSVFNSDQSIFQGDFMVTSAYRGEKTLFEKPSSKSKLRENFSYNIVCKFSVLFDLHFNQIDAGFFSLNHHLPHEVKLY